MYKHHRSLSEQLGQQSTMVATHMYSGAAEANLKLLGHDFFFCVYTWPGNEATHLRECIWAFTDHKLKAF